VEKIRELATSLLAGLLAAAPSAAPLLAAVAPALRARASGAGSFAAGEPSEEIRLALVALLAAAAARAHAAAAAEPHPLAPVAADVTAVLVAALGDPFPELVKSAAAASFALASALPRAALAPHAPPLLAALLAATGHRHAAVRLGALRALDALALAAAPPEAVAESIAPGVRSLAFDAQPHVREALYGTLAGWLTRMTAPLPPGAAAAAARAHGLVQPPRLLHAPVLLPLLLLGATDDAPGLADAALRNVEAVADAWAASAGDGDAAMDIDEEVSDAVSQEATPCLWLPPPFSRRPSRAARAMVAALLPALLAPALSDLKEWSPGVRAAASRLLLASLLAAEGAAMHALHRILPALSAAVGDDDAPTAARCVSCAHVLGRYISPSAWLPLALEPVVDARAAPGARTCALLVLAALLRTSGGRLSSADADAVAAALAAPPLADAAAEHAPMRAQAAAAARNLAIAGGAAAAATAAPRLFRTLLSLSAATASAAASDAASAAPTPPSEADVAAAARADEALEALALAAGRPSAELYAEHAGSLLRDLSAEAPRWASASAPGLAAFCALLRRAPAGALAPHAARIAAVVAACAGGERPAGVRLAALSALGELAECPVRGAMALAPAARALLGRALAPQLAWRAGRAAAAARFAALAATEALLRRGGAAPDDVAALLRGDDDDVASASAQPASAQHPAGSALLRGLASCLEEDYYAETRCAAAHALAHALSAGGRRLRGAPRAWLSLELLKRLDDSRNDIRAAGAGALGAFVAALPPAEASACASSDDASEDAWSEACGTHLVGALMPHLDDADAAVRRAVGAVAVAAAARHPGAAREAASRARATALHPESYDAVLAAAAAAAATTTA
jgi:dynein assembly factor 5